MDILIDTNQLWGDPLMELAEWQSVWAYLERTDSKLLVPMVVRLEATSNHRERCEKARNLLAKYAGEFRRLTGKEIVLLQPGADGTYLPMPGVAGDAEAYEKRWEYLLASGRVVILPFTAEAARIVAERGARRQPPQHNKKDNTNDTNVWLTLLATKDAPAREIVFISHDTSAFATGGELHPGLRKELGDSQIHFCLGLQDFIDHFGGEPLKLLDEPVDLVAKIL